MYEIFGNYNFRCAENWTQAAIDCYHLGCDCSKCAVKDVMGERKCRMKAVVLELVRKYGKPPKILDNKKGRPRKRGKND